MKNLALYQNHLENVSRSFAFCIPILNAELRYQVSLSYLLFRVVDTIEDSVWSSRQSQTEAFGQFLNFIQQGFTFEEIEIFKKRLPLSVPVQERNLIESLPILLDDLKLLPEKARVSLQQNLIVMVKGMQHFSSPEHAVIKSITELNRYCFFVAGIVGELLTELAYKKELSLPSDEELLLKSHHFGLFLQKVNILKDQKKDEDEGRFFVPDRQLIWQSLNADSDFAFSYIRQLPTHLRDYKLFCAYSFFLGLFSLSYIEKSWMSQVAERIPRTMTAAFLSQVEDKIDDLKALDNLYFKYKNNLPAESNLGATPQNAQLPAWFSESYGRFLPSQHVISLQI